MKYSRVVIFLFFLSSCVSPLDVSTGFKSQIVVEGMITDQPGPYLLKISRTIPVNEQLQGIEGISGASVTIFDDQGNSESLIEKSSGNYYTQTFQGIVGQSYWIKIATSEGDIYQSTHEKLLPVGDFTNITYEFKQTEASDADLQVSSKNGFSVFIDSEVLPEQTNRVWWRWTGTFKIFTYPQLQLKSLATNPPREPPLFIPDPPPCSGWTVRNPDRPTATLVGPLADCECCTCWVTQYNTVPLISNPKFVSNGSINKFNVAFIEANRRTFYEKYYLEIEQLSPSQVVYDFWKDVIVQESNGSNLFQTPPPKTSGNISATSPNATPAIGYFAACSSKKHAIEILREQVPYFLRPIDTLALSCTSAYVYSTTKQPTFW